MISNGPFGGQVLIADTTIWSIVPRVPEPTKDEWAEALRAGQIWTSPVVALEWLHDARDQVELEDRRLYLDRLKSVAVNQTICTSAVRSLVELATSGPSGNHRVPAGDALIAASAADRGFAVLHYDSHYDKLAEALSFESVWISPPGSI